MLADELVLTHRLFNLGFQQNIMTFMLGWYMMHQLKGISQLLNIVYVKHTKKEKKHQPYTEHDAYPFWKSYIYRKRHWFEDRREEISLINVPWSGPLISLWERFCETSASWSVLMRYLKMWNIFLKLLTQESFSKLIMEPNLGIT